jgi:hypothetical protein
MSPEPIAKRVRGNPFLVRAQFRRKVHSNGHSHMSGNREGDGLGCDMIRFIRGRMHRD